jgi:hypothetical protein
MQDTGDGEMKSECKGLSVQTMRHGQCGEDLARFRRAHRQSARCHDR